MNAWTVSVTNAEGTAGDTVVVSAEAKDVATECTLAELAALYCFPEGWIATESHLATDEDRAVATDLTGDTGNAPVAQQGSPEWLAAHEELHSLPIVPPGIPPEDG